MSVFFTSDHHFGHDKPFIVQARGFNSVEEMNERLIQDWNAVVTPGDTVYHLGDVAFSELHEFKSIMDRLNGSITLILGSHDKIATQYKQRFQHMTPHLHRDIEKQSVTMIHCCPKVWEKSHFGAWALFGHSHGGLNSYAATEGKLLDVGVDSHYEMFGNFQPFTWEEVKTIMRSRPGNFNSLHPQYKVGDEVIVKYIESDDWCGTHEGQTGVVQSVVGSGEASRAPFYYDLGPSFCIEFQEKELLPNTPENASWIVNSYEEYSLEDDDDKSDKYDHDY
jgi:calcineurin-like phosphoesterase family protein